MSYNQHYVNLKPWLFSPSGPGSEVSRPASIAAQSPSGRCPARPWEARRISLARIATPLHAHRECALETERFVIPVSREPCRLADTRFRLSDMQHSMLDPKSPHS